ncbi:hypothetical protein D3C80_2142480 [compost metagenome]
MKEEDHGFRTTLVFKGKSVNIGHASFGQRNQVLLFRLLPAHTVARILLFQPCTGRGTGDKLGLQGRK